MNGRPARKAAQHVAEGTEEGHQPQLGHLSDVETEAQKAYLACPRSCIQ